MNLRSLGTWHECTVRCRVYRSRPNEAEHRPRTCCSSCHQGRPCCPSRATDARCSTMDRVSITRTNKEHPTYLVVREQENIGAKRVHLVTLTRMDSFLLYSLELQWLQILIEHLTLEESEYLYPSYRSSSCTYQIHDDTIMNCENTCQH